MAAIWRPHVAVRVDKLVREHRLLEEAVAVRVGLDAEAHGETAKRDRLHLDVRLHHQPQRQQLVGQLAHRHPRLRAQGEAIDVDGEDVVHVRRLDQVALALVGAQLRAHRHPVRARGAQLSLPAGCVPRPDRGRDGLDRGGVGCRGRSAALAADEAAEAPARHRVEPAGVRERHDDEHQHGRAHLRREAELPWEVLGQRSIRPGAQNGCQSEEEHEAAKGVARRLAARHERGKPIGRLLWRRRCRQNQRKELVGEVLHRWRRNGGLVLGRARSPGDGGIP